MFDELRQQYDQSNLYRVIENLPGQLISALNFTEIKFNSVPRRIFIFGVGGSALPANILKTIINNSQQNFTTPIHIIRDYSFPKDFNDDDGAIFISYSGNTEEPLENFDQALKLNHKNLLVLTTGGQLQKIADENSVPLTIIPSDALQPRMGYGYFVGALMKILISSHLLEDHYSIIEQTVAQLNAEKEKIINQAQQLSKNIKQSTPIIYTTDRWKYLAMIVKINFNENAKIPSFWNCFPELNHNEMVGFTNTTGNYQIIIFNDPEEHPRNQKRIKVFQKFMETKFPIEIINFPTGNALYKTFHILWLGLWTSYFTALQNKIDPTPVDLVEEFKKLLNE